MTVVALLFVPMVMAYQLWVYWVFRRPVTKEDIQGNKELTENESLRSRLRGISGLQFLLTKQVAGNITRRDLNGRNTFEGPLEECVRKIIERLRSRLSCLCPSG